MLKAAALCPFPFHFGSLFNVQFSSNLKENCPERMKQNQTKKKNLPYFFQQTPLCHTSSCREFLFQTDDVMGFVSQRCNE